MLPLSLLRTAAGHPMLVELKNGETYNGHLVSCDNWMNISLREVICTSRDGDRFWRLPEVIIRGNKIKYLRIPEEARAPACASAAPDLPSCLRARLLFTLAPLHGARRRL